MLRGTASASHSAQARARRKPKPFWSCVADTADDRDDTLRYEAPAFAERRPVGVVQVCNFNGKQQNPTACRLPPVNDTDDPFEWHGIDPLRLATMASSLPWVCPQPARGRAYSSVLDSPRARRSFGSILDPGQAVESISGGSHIVLLGWLFFRAGTPSSAPPVPRWCPLLRWPLFSAVWCRGTRAWVRRRQGVRAAASSAAGPGAAAQRNLHRQQCTTAADHRQFVHRKPRRCANATNPLVRARLVPPRRRFSRPAPMSRSCAYQHSGESLNFATVARQAMRNCL